MMKSFTETPSGPLLIQSKQFSQKLLGYDKNARLTKHADRRTSDERTAMSPSLFNDLPKAGTFPHEEWTKIDDLKLDRPLDKPFLLDSSAGEEKEKTAPEKSPNVPEAGTFPTASQPRQKKPDKVNRRENARFDTCHYIFLKSTLEIGLHRVKIRKDNRSGSSGAWCKRYGCCFSTNHMLCLCLLRILYV